MQIGAYVGIPLHLENGALFGTLCAIDRKEQNEDIRSLAPMLEVVGNLLATVLHQELRNADDVLRAEQAEWAAMTDALTGLSNRRAWESSWAEEEARCKRHGHCASVLSVDLDGLKAANDTRGHSIGDALLRVAAKALRAAVRGSEGG